MCVRACECVSQLVAIKINLHRKLKSSLYQPHHMTYTQRGHSYCRYCSTMGHTHTHTHLQQCIRVFVILPFSTCHSAACQLLVAVAFIVAAVSSVSDKARVHCQLHLFQLTIMVTTTTMVLNMQTKIVQYSSQRELLKQPSCPGTAG